jgi:ATP:ADP antiporter, AAA family
VKTPKETQDSAASEVARAEPQFSTSDNVTPSYERILASALRPFAKVDPLESVTLVVLTVTAFLLLTAYYLLKTAREPLILLGGGAEVKSYAAAGQALLLLAVVRGYGALAKRAGRLRLIAYVYLFFASNLLVFSALAWRGVPIGVPFYLWVGVFNYTSIAQFWAFATDVYSPEQGKRLFAVLGIGSSVGAVAGARIAHALVPLGPHMLMLVATGLLLVCVVLFAWVDARSRAQLAPGVGVPDQPLGDQSVLELLARDRYLMLLAVLTLLLNWVNANGEYVLDRTLLDTLAQMPGHVNAAAFIGRFKADYFGWINLVGVILQLFVVSRVLTRFGVRAALFVLPFVAFGAYGIIAVAPRLMLVRFSKIAENSIDYSLQNTARQALYLITTRAQRFVGKTAIDTFFVRFGDVLSAGLVWLGTRLALPTFAFATVNLVLIVIWVGVVVALAREHRRRSGEDEAPGLGMKRVVAVVTRVAETTSASAGVQHAEP